MNHSNEQKENVLASSSDKDLEIDLSFFPANVYYKHVGIEYFLLKRKIQPTPMMVQLFKDIEIKDVTEFPQTLESLQTITFSNQ